MISRTHKRNIIKKLGQPEKFFAVLTFISGFVLAFIIPPFQTPDASIHIYRAYELAEFGHPNIERDGRVGSLLPRSIRTTELITHGQVTSPARADQIAFNMSNKFHPGSVKDALGISLNKDDRIFYATGTSPAYVPISYLPQAAIAFVANLFEAPVIVTMYLMRLINLMLWILAGYFAIKILPFKRWTVEGILLFPVMISQTVSEGLDVGVYAAFIIFLAFIVSRVVDKSLIVSKRHITGLIILTFIMLSGKSVLAVFIPMIFLIKNYQINAHKPALIKVVAILLPVLIYYAWTYVAASTGGSSINVGPALQLESLKSMPWHFIHMLLNTLVMTTASGALLTQSLAGNFGYLDAPMAPLIMAFSFMLISLVMLLSYEPTKITGRVKYFMGSLAIIYMIAVFLAMFLYFSLPPDNHIRGVQGRYLVPAMLVVPLVGTIATMDKNKYKRLVLFSSVALHIFMFTAITLRYYVSYTPS